MADRVKLAEIESAASNLITVTIHDVSEPRNVNPVRGVSGSKYVASIPPERALVLIVALRRAREALTRVSEGAGAFSRDPHQHAINVIEETKEVARLTLRAIDARVDFSR